MFYVLEIIGYSPDRRSEKWIAFKNETAYVTNEIEKAIKFYDNASAGSVLRFVASNYKTRGMIIMEMTNEDSVTNLTSLPETKDSKQ